MPALLSSRHNTGVITLLVPATSAERSTARAAAGKGNIPARASTTIHQPTSKAKKIRNQKIRNHNPVINKREWEILQPVAWKRWSKSEFVLLRWLQGRGIQCLRALVIPQDWATSEPTERRNSIMAIAAAEFCFLTRSLNWEFQCLAALLHPQSLILNSPTPPSKKAELWGFYECEKPICLVLLSMFYVKVLSGAWATFGTPLPFEVLGSGCPVSRSVLSLTPAVLSGCAPGMHLFFWFHLKETEFTCSSDLSVIQAVV